MHQKKQVTEKIQPIILTSHRGHKSRALPIQWGARDPRERGPIVASLTDVAARNVIGTYSGSYTVYRALAVASGALQPEHKPDLTDTSPTHLIGPYESWFDPERIISFDPFGAIVSDVYAEELKTYDIRPTIAITKAHIQMPELLWEIREGRLQPDGKILTDTGHCDVVKVAVEPVWFLPGMAERFGISEAKLRRALFEYTGGMFPELITRSDLKVFLPPIGGMTAYIFGDVKAIPDPNKPLAVRVHDECNGSDVFGSDICTCRPYLVHGIEVCIQTAQQGGSGIIVYFRKEGRALGEVTKFLVYNARKRQEGGDRASAYFERTECVAGVEDVRFQELMPDILHWLGVKKIDKLVSMSNMKYDAIVSSGIEVSERLSIPEDLIPPDAMVEIYAKRAAGYFSSQEALSGVALESIKGKDWQTGDVPSEEESSKEELSGDPS
ncbi:MAG: GTP cyclohydrolase II [Myxococcota bacterium]